MPMIRVIDEFDEVLHNVPVISGATFADAAIAEWPDGFPGMTVFVMDPNMKMITTNEAVSVRMVDGDEWTIALRPQDPLSAVAFTLFASSSTFAISVTWLQIAVVAANFAMSYMMRPEMPNIGAAYQWDDSDRPQFFSAQSNSMKPGSRVPEVFGKIRIWPDLIVEPWVKYSGDSQELRELYVVSNGKCDISEARLHDEGIDSLPVSSITVHQPGQVWPPDFPVMRTNSFVARIELPGPNEKGSFGVSVDLDATVGTFFVNTTDYFKNFNVVVGDFFAISGNGVNAANIKIYYLDSVSPDGKTLNVTPNPGATESVTDGTLVFRAISNILAVGNTPTLITTTGWETTIPDKWVTTEGHDVPPFTAGVAVDPSSASMTDTSCSFGTFVHSDDSSYFRLVNRYAIGRDVNFGYTTTSFNFLTWANTSFDPNIPGDGFATTALNVPGTSVGVAFDIEFPGGMYSQAAGESPRAVQVDIELGWRLIDATTWSTETHTFTTDNGVRTPRVFTIEKAWSSGEYEVYFRRLTDFVPDTSTLVTVDACRLVSLRGRQDTTSLIGDVLNVTLVELHLTTQNAAQVSQSRSFNVLAHRWLPNYYNGGAIEATRRVRDAILYTLIDDAGISIDNIDDVALDAINDDLNAISADEKRFDGVIDQTMSTDDQLSLLCSPYRIVPFRRAGYISFSRLKAGLIPRGLINARNKIEPESRTMNFSMFNEPDAIIIRYLDRQNDYKESAIQYPAGGDPIRTSEQSIIGVTRGDVATRIAQYMWNKRINERDTLEVTTTEDSILLAPGEVIAVTDHLRVEKPIDGEVVEITAPDTFRFDDAIPAGIYIGRLRDMNGDMISTEISITLTGDSDTHTIPEWAGATQSDRNTTQVGLLYSFTPVGTAADSELWHVQSVSPSRDGRVKVSCVQYSDDAYASDAAAVVAIPAIKRIRTGGA